MTQPQDNASQAVRTSARSTASVVMEARSLKKIYGSGEKSLAVLSDANLSLRQGEMVAIVAPSGAGKSTLLHLLAALDTPTSGTVYFANKAIETIDDDAALAEFRNRAVGFLWQRHQLLPDFTAAENVAMPLLLRGEDFTSALGMARKWLAEVGLENRADHRAGELSGGEQQRVAIARALVTGPSVLPDEPTGDLDEQNAWAVFELLERLHRAHQLTSLIATHNLALAARCDRILALEHGVLRTRKASAEASGAPGGEAS